MQTTNRRMPAHQVLPDVDPLARSGRLRWLLVLVPAGVVLVLELLSDTILDESLPFPWDMLLVTAAVLVISIAIAALAFRRIDALTGILRARNADLEARGASARALYRVSVAVASQSDIDHVLDSVVTHARSLLDAEVAVLLLEEADGRLVRRAASGAPSALVEPAPTPASTEVATDAILPFIVHEAAVARLAAPLVRGGETTGLLAICSATERGFDADEVETLAALANQAAIALEHARLEERLRELAVVEERERIARELHDGIAQVLGYVNTKSQAIDGYLADGRVREARTQTSELGVAARAAYVDVREAILGLRSPIEPGLGLGGAVERHAQRVAADSRFALEVSIPPDVRQLRLDQETEAQVYRIVQESLTNVRKHASARRVRVSMASADGCLTLRVEDDGRGLGSSGAVPEVPHYGLRTMRERAAAIGGELEVRSGPRGGVLVILELPLAGHGRTTGEPQPVAGR